MFYWRTFSKCGSDRNWKGKHIENLSQVYKFKNTFEARTFHTVLYRTSRAPANPFEAVEGNASRRNKMGSQMSNHVLKLNSFSVSALNIRHSCQILSLKSMGVFLLIFLNHWSDPTFQCSLWVRIHVFQSNFESLYTIKTSYIQYYHILRISFKNTTIFFLSFFLCRWASLTYSNFLLFFFLFNVFCYLFILLQKNLIS